ncbi:uncharacterized protein LOC135694516 [Rhopilema esculentum]|uniref:uncharacterized protein LOC135694516 n=1 Tax=Rhopilema esculentum TaxID=499914 RepID=UPI0031D30DB1
MFFKVYTIYTLSLLGIFMKDLSTLSQASSAANGNLQEVSVQKLEHLVFNRQWDQPFCILFLHKSEGKQIITTKARRIKKKRTVSSLEKKVTKLMTRKYLKQWWFGKLDIAKENYSSRISLPASNEVLRCYIGTSSHFDYEPKVSLKKWIKKVVVAYKSRLETVTSADIESIFTKDQNKNVFIVVLPGLNYFQVIEPQLLEMRRECPNCRVIIVPSGSEQERVFQEKFNVFNHPIAFIFHRKKLKLVPQLKQTLEGLYSVSKETVLLHVIRIKTKAQSLAFDNFKTTAMMSRHDEKPFIVCFYSSNNPESYKFVHAFDRSVDYFTSGAKNHNRINLRFGIVDLADSENSKILSRYLDVTTIKKIPFLAAFWQSHNESGDHSNHHIQHKILSDIIPTPGMLQSELNDIDILNVEENAFENKFCYQNRTKDFCDLEERPLVRYGPNVDKYFLEYKRKKELLKKRAMKYHNGIPMLTDKLWPQIIDRTSQAKKSLHETYPGQEKAATVKLVIFIMADCGFCEIMMPKFSNLTSLTKRMHGVSVYLMNCTSDPVNCKRNKVTGYPTLALFRSISEEESRTCLIANSTSSSVRLDYHGNMEIGDILNWLSKAAMSAVEFYFVNKSWPKMNKDVRLVAHLYTRTLARKYLSRSLQHKLIPLQCFKLACEKLFGSAECIAVPSEDLVTEKVWKNGIMEKQLVVEQVLFERSDGAKATVFKLSYPMDRTLELSGDTKLHKFHRNHRYKIPSGFRCEENHPLCTDILVKFVEDHQRLPITHISRESFHAHGASSSIFSKEFPVLIALVHKNNISSNSSFLKELQKAAHELYTTMIVATLNVDEFPSWASQFVPRNYHYHHHDIMDKTPALYYYPRFCIIDWDDHQRAAFYPPLDELEEVPDVRKRLAKVKAKDIIQFSGRYLKNQAAVLVDTEMF